MIQIEMFPQEILDLQQELCHPDHHKLAEILNSVPDLDIYVRMAQVAAHLNIILDGAYDKGDMLDLAKLLRKKLYESRAKIILPFSCN